MKLKCSSQKTYVQSPFEKGKYACPLCEGTNRMKCQVTEDGGLAYCENTPNSSGKTDSLGRYEHILNKSTGGASSAPPIKPVVAKPEAQKKDAATLNRVYSELLDALTLSDKHFGDLFFERGLKGLQIEKNRYVSVPSYNEGQAIAKVLGKKFNLEGIPGFYRQSDDWKLNVIYPGFYVPYRDRDGNIVGLQIRLDKPQGKQKYSWVSSADKDKGVSSGSPLHFVNPDITARTKTVYVTEGALKADIIGSRLDVGVIATAGVTFNVRKVLAEIFEAFPDLEKIIVAYDSDWATNINVRKAVIRLLKALGELKRAEVVVAYWESTRGKGLDDLVINNDFEKDEINCLPYQEFVDKFLSNLSSETLNDSGRQNDSDEQIETEKLIEIGKQIKEVAKSNEDDEIGQLWKDFSTGRFPSSEKVIFGLGRGNLGLLVASTNIGKSTLITNLSLCMTSKQPFSPLYEGNGKAKRVMYIDGEASKEDLRADIRTMLSRFSPSQIDSVNNNLLIICDEEINEEPIDLSVPTHLQKIKERAMEFHPDFIVIDTLSALINVEDENDNALVKKEVIQPLKQLAKATHSAVLLLHHTGKYNEGYSPTGAYKGRGASAFGALSRLVLTLDKPKNSNGDIRLTCAKVKGEKFPNTLIKLDQNTRWFSVTGIEKTETVVKGKDEYSKVVKFVLEYRQPIKRAKIVTNFEGKISRSNVDRHLKNAIKENELNRTKLGLYSAPRNPNKELPLAE